MFSTLNLSVKEPLNGSKVLDMTGGLTRIIIHIIINSRISGEELGFMCFWRVDKQMLPVLCGFQKLRYLCRYPAVSLHFNYRNCARLSHLPIMK